MTHTTIPDLIHEIKTRAKGRKRLIVAINGAPGAGKSTLAEEIVRRLGPEAACLPMDGFHLDNDRLHSLGLFERKGAPETFDATGFVALMRSVQEQPHVTYPTFDRAADRSIPDAGQIDASTRIVVVEGNYLLLDTPPWRELADLFDLTIGLQVDRDVLLKRLIQRWRDHGLSEEDARIRARNNDMRNADQVIESSRKPDFILRTP